MLPAWTVATLLVAVGALVPFISATVSSHGLLTAGKLVVPLVIALALRRALGRDLIESMWLGCCLGGCLAGLVATVQVAGLGEPRADGLTGNAIVFGALSLTSAAMAVGLHPSHHHTDSQGGG